MHVRTDTSQLTGQARVHANACMHACTDACARWSGFEANGKEGITIGDGLSHRAGLRARSLFPPRFIGLVCRGRFADCTAVGIDWIRACTPSWRGAYARYHPVSWSWIAAGLYAHLKGEHIQEGAASLARLLGVRPSELRLGEVLNGEEPARLSMPLAAIGRDAWHAAWERLGSTTSLHTSLLLALAPLAVAAALMLCVAAVLESVVCVGLANCRLFLRLCLPSSNGTFTARALGRLYGALANGGVLADGTVVLSAAACAQLETLSLDMSLDVGGFPAAGRQTCGFSPWLGAQCESRWRSPGRLAILGHTGMGGCCAYADLSSGLAVAVLKNAFSPEALNAGGVGSPGRAFVLVDGYLREHLHLMGTDSTRHRHSQPERSRARRASRSPAPLVLSRRQA